jgi:NAD(P)-dependent dehydrogenase (short-subunit alcohol dehydrogenase family)
MAARNPSAGEAAAAELRSAAGCVATLTTLQLDQTDEASIAAAARTLEQEVGRLDVLINNAGIATTDAVPSQRTLQSVLLTNAAGPVLVSNALMPLLDRSARPYLINVSSGLGSMTLASSPEDPARGQYWLEYRMSKAALNMATVQQTVMWADKAVKIFAMCPGLVVSNLRGKSEDARQAGGYAGDPDVSGQTILSIVEGKRDADEGKFVHKDGVYAW